MFCVRKVIQMEKKDDVFQLRPLGDIHVGSPSFDKEKFERIVTDISKMDNAIVIGMGDYIDNVLAYSNGTLDKRWNYHAQNRTQMTTLEQVSYFTKWWAKVADKSVGMHSGNHEWKTVDQQRFVMDFCNPVESRIVETKGGVQLLEPIINEKTGKADVLYHNKYLGRLAYVNIGFEHNGKRIRDFLILSMHGGYSGMKAGGAVNRMKDITADFDCDIVLMGHNHDTWTRPILRMGYDLKSNSPVEKTIRLANTGTFMKSYSKDHDGYVEINPKEAKRVGTVTLTLYPETGKTHGHD